MTYSVARFITPCVQKKRNVCKIFFQALFFVLLLLPAKREASAAVSPDILVTKVTYQILNDGSIKAGIFLNKLPDIKYRRLKSQKLVYVDLNNTKLGKTAKRKIVLSPPSFLKMIHSAQNRVDRVRVVFRLTENAEYSVRKISDPPQIEVHLKSNKKSKVVPPIVVVPKTVKKVAEPDSEGAISRARTMDEAQLAMNLKDYGKVLRLYKEILKLPTNTYTQEALEQSAVANEKLGRSGEAKKLYKKYLKLYPSTDGARRVNERLTHLKNEAARLKGVFKQASQALDTGEYAIAVKLFSELLDNGYKRKASLEFLGVAYEKNGQIESAIDESNTYLKFYPKGPGADRVRARLENLWEKDERSDKRFAEAGKALTGGEYKRSARLYEGLLESGKYKERSLEFLGLSYEKMGDNKSAVARYEEYLNLYPKEDGSNRVAQRLAGLKTARSVAKKKLKKVKKKKDRSSYYGSFSQSYDRDDSYTDLGEVLHNTSSLTTNLNFKFRGRNDLYDKRLVFSGGYERDFLDAEDSVFRLSRVYYDIKNKKKKVSMRVGRQQSSSGGVFSRFDGGIFGVRLNNELKLNFVTGLPQDTTKLDSRYETDRYFVGLNLEIGTFKERWDFNTFVINQMVDGTIDRQGAGAEVRYFHNRKSVFGYVDYDLHFDQLNVFLFSGNLTFKNNTTFNFSLDYRKSPLLTTSNALNTPGVESLTDLFDVMGSSEVEKLAEDVTSTLKSLTLGLNHSLTEKLQVSGDLTVTSTTATKGAIVPLIDPFTNEPTEVFPQEGSGNDYFYNLQFIRNSVLMANDIAIFGLRYSDTKKTDTYSVLFNTRFPYTRNFKVSPRMRVDYRTRQVKFQETLQDENSIRVRPTIRMNYRWRKSIWFDLDSGIDWDKDLTDSANSPTSSTTSYSISLGYRVEF